MTSVLSLPNPHKRTHIDTLELGSNELDDTRPDTLLSQVGNEHLIAWGFEKWSCMRYAHLLSWNSVMEGILFKPLPIYVGIITLNPQWQQRTFWERGPTCSRATLLLKHVSNSSRSGIMSKKYGS